MLLFFQGGVAKPIISDQNNQHLSFRYFVNKRVKFFWNTKKDAFEELLGIEPSHTNTKSRSNSDISLSLICNETSSHGLTEPESHRRLQIYEANSIRVDLTPIGTLLIREVLSPFYVFQIFSITLWCFENYFYYAACIFIISATSIIYSLYSIRRNEQALRDMISNASPVRVHRNGRVSVISSEQLVPGDLIEIEKG